IPLGDASRPRGMGRQDPARGKTPARLEMKIEAGRIAFLARSEVRKICRYVSLVRTLVLRKADIAIDAKQRTAARSRISDKARADPVKHRCKIRNEAEERIAHRVFISAFVLGEPLTVVVVLEFL